MYFLKRKIFLYFLQRKLFLYFLKREPFLYFFKRNLFLYFFKRKLFLYFPKWNPALLNLRLKNKTSYASGNKNPRKPSYIFSKECCCYVSGNKTLKKLFIFKAVTPVKPENQTFFIHILIKRQSFLKSKYFFMIITNFFFSLSNTFFYTQQAFAFHLLRDFCNVYDQIATFFLFLFLKDFDIFQKRFL